MFFVQQLDMSVKRKQISSPYSVLCLMSQKREKSLKVKKNYILCVIRLAIHNYIQNYACT